MTVTTMMSKPTTCTLYAFFLYFVGPHSYYAISFLACFIFGTRGIIVIVTVEISCTFMTMITIGLRLTMT